MKRNNGCLDVTHLESQYQKNGTPDTTESSQSGSGTDLLNKSKNSKQGIVGYCKTKTEKAGALFLDTFKVGDLLGEGTYGKVKLARNMKENREVALKIINKRNIKKKSHLRRVLREIRIMSVVDHPNLCKFYQSFETDDAFIIELEYIRGKELFNYISEKRWLSESETRRIFYQLLEGVNYLHQHKIIHRDIKPENIIINRKGVVKIIDFGFACTYEYFRFCDTHCGSPYYAAPEMVSASDYIGPEVDVWSLGIVLYTLIHGVLPFEADCIKNLYVKILSCKYVVDKRATPLLKSLIKSMIHFDGRSRIRMNEILKHPWIKYDPQLITRVPISEIDKDVVQKLIEYEFCEDKIMNALTNVYSTEWCFYKLICDKVSKGCDIEHIGLISDMRSGSVEVHSTYNTLAQDFGIPYRRKNPSKPKDNCPVNTGENKQVVDEHIKTNDRKKIRLDAVKNHSPGLQIQSPTHLVIERCVKYSFINTFNTIYGHIIKNRHRCYRSNNHIKILIYNEEPVLFDIQIFENYANGCTIKASLITGSFEAFEEEMREIFYNF